MEDLEFMKVTERKDGIKFVTIPKKSSIQKGDYVLITKDIDFIKDIQMVKEILEKEVKNGGKRKGSS